MSIPVLSQHRSISVFRIFGALPVPLAKFYYQIYTFHQNSLTFGFGVADSPPPVGVTGFRTLVKFGTTLVPAPVTRPLPQRLCRICIARKISRHFGLV